jgi:hypothetical protein
MSIASIEVAARLWLEKNKIHRPIRESEARALYRYLNAGQYRELRERLSGWISKFPLDCSAPAFAATFCLFVAEWYKREFREGHWSWDGPCAAIGLPKEHSLLRELTETGLCRYWRQPIIRGDDGTNEYLLSLILQGGIPTGFAANERGWLLGYVRSVLRDVEADGQLNADCALRHAVHHGWRVPETFRKSPLLRLVAELALQLAVLRAHTANRPAGMDLVAWLDGHRPGWRDELPIEMEDGSAKVLIEGLVRENAGSNHGALRVERVLLPDIGGERRLGLRMVLDGDADPRILCPEISLPHGATRVRLMSSGALAERLHGCIALLERRSGDDIGWIARANVPSHQRLVGPFSLHLDAEAVLRVEGADTRSFILPGGQRLLPDVLAFRLRDGESVGSELPLLSAGSARTRDARLCFAVTGGLRGQVRRVEGSLALVGAIEDGDLYLLEGKAEIDVEDRLKVRFVTGAAAESVTRLEAMGQKPQDIRADVPLFQGWPKFVEIGVGGLISQRSDRQILWRHAGLAQSWRSLDRNRPPVGLIEVASVDDGVLQARLRLGLLPPGARVDRVAGRRDGAAVAFRGFADVELRTSFGDRHVTIGEIDEDVVRIDVTGHAASARELQVRLRWPQSKDLDVLVPISCAPVSFYGSNGFRLRNRETESLDRLRGATLETTMPATLDITLVEAGHHTNGSPTLRRPIDGTVPFSMLRGEIEALLSLSADLDAQVRVEATAGGVSVRLDVARFAISLHPQGGAVCFDPAGVDRFPADAQIIVVGHKFADLAGPETVLASPRVSEASQVRVEVPDGEGPWLVFARIAGETVSRPLLVTRSLEPEKARNLRRLAKALVGPQVPRESEILAAFDDLSDGKDATVAEDLMSLVRTYRTVLPLQSFDALVRLAEAPRAAVALLWSATGEDLAAVIDLERELPFSWITTPIESWIKAVQQGTDAHKQLCRSHALDESHALAATDHKLSRIKLLAPQLAVHLGFAAAGCGLPIDGDLDTFRRLSPTQAAGLAEQFVKGMINDCVARNGERRAPPVDLGFRRVRDPDSRFAAYDPAFHDLLDAPFVAAELALGRRRPSSHVERGLRLCRLYDPAYVDEAFCFALFCIRGETSSVQVGVDRR